MIGKFLINSVISHLVGIGHCGSRNLTAESDKDTCICPDCRTELHIQEYGRNLECSECGCKIDVFPDVDLYVDTGFGVIGISFPKDWKNKLWLGMKLLGMHYMKRLIG